MRPTAHYGLDLGSQGHFMLVHGQVYLVRKRPETKAYLHCVGREFKTDAVSTGAITYVRDLFPDDVKYVQYDAPSHSVYIPGHSRLVRKLREQGHDPVKLGLEPEPKAPLGGNVKSRFATKVETTAPVVLTPPKTLPAWAEPFIDLEKCVIRIPEVALQDGVYDISRKETTYKPAGAPYTGVVDKGSIVGADLSELEIRTIAWHQDFLKSIRKPAHDDPWDALPLSFNHQGTTTGRLASSPTALTTIPKEDPMSSIITITTQTLINGSEALTYTNNQLYALIKASEKRIEELQALKTKPKSLTAEIESLQAGIKALVEYMDGRKA